MSQTIGLVGSLTLLAAGVVHAAVPASPLITQAKKAIAADLTDPGSIQYRGIRTVHKNINGNTLTIVCGEYNTKNRLGGYVGFVKFAYEPTVLHGIVSTNNDGGLDMHGASSGLDDDSALKLKAEVLMPCLGD